MVELPAAAGGSAMRNEWCLWPRDRKISRHSRSLVLQIWMFIPIRGVEIRYGDYKDVSES